MFCSRCGAENVLKQRYCRQWRMSIWRSSYVVSVKAEVQKKNLRGGRTMRKQILLAVVALMLTSLVAGDSAAQGQEKQSLYVGIFKATNLDFVKKGPRPEDMPLIRQHVEMLQKLGDQGISIIAGHTTNHDETAFGLAVVRAASQDAARKILEEDPLVRAGILTVTV